MQLGMRFYEDSDSVEFLSTPEPEFDYFEE
jgi:hypothetical protein